MEKFKTHWVCLPSRVDGCTYYITASYIVRIWLYISRTTTPVEGQLTFHLAASLCISHKQMFCPIVELDSSLAHCSLVHWELASKW